MNNPRFWISCEGISLAALLSVTSIGSAEVVKFKADLKATDGAATPAWSARVKAEARPISG
jgi:hypothetical protein